VKIKSWRLDTNIFDGNLLAGPVPALFGPPDAAAALTKDAPRCQGDLLKLHKHFFTPEYITTKEASSLLRKPREGEAHWPFKKPRMQPLPPTERPPPTPPPTEPGPSSSGNNKRPRIESSSDTGTICYGLFSKHIYITAGIFYSLPKKPPFTSKG